MAISQGAHIEQLSWLEARPAVLAVNPSLAAAIDAFSPGPDFHLYKVWYRFGDLILQRGLVTLPLEQGRCVLLTHPEIPNFLREELSYNTIPVGLFLNGTGENFVEPDPVRIVSLNTFSAGNFFGLWEALNPPDSYFNRRIWSLAAGARSLFMLPKISDNTCHARMKRELGLRAQAPKSMLDHFGIFRELTQVIPEGREWHVNVLYFNKKWFEERPNDAAWIRWHHFLLEDAWAQSLLWRNKVTFDLMWDMFAMEAFRKNLRPKPHLIDTVKHLVLAASGATPAFGPTGITDTVAPISLIQRVYTELYGLKYYYPTMMRPIKRTLPHSTENYLYYSLQVPTLLTSAPRLRNAPSAMHDIREVKVLLEALCNKLATESVPFYGLMKPVRFDYFHSEEDPYGEIRLSESLAEDDDTLNMTAITTHDERRFCESSAFVRGCVRIKLENTPALQEA